MNLASLTVLILLATTSERVRSLKAAMAYPSSGLRCEGRYDVEIQAASRAVSNVWLVPPALIEAVIEQESAFDARALSRAGAVGLMQVLPRNAEQLGVQPEELWEPAQNILAGTRMLAVLLRHYQGDVISALVAYNARPQRLFAPLPDNGETALYVRAVLRHWQAFRDCEAST